MTLEPGTTLGRYQILAPLGHGGMASVYKAFQPALDRVVALKVLRAGFEDAEFLERFEREAKAIARLRHPHIVQVFDFDSHQGRYFMAMEYLEGGTLKAKLAELAAEGRGLPPKEAGRIVGEVADALGHAHEQGIVHRDVKPSNVLLTRAGRAVVADFGIAKIFAATGQTQTGVGVGTPEYMSPEQGQGRPVDHRSDIYSLGVVAYELLTGSVPFSADTPLAVVYAHAHDPLPLPSRRNPRIGPRTEQALLRALAKEAAGRYARAADFSEALERGLAEDAQERSESATDSAEAIAPSTGEKERGTLPTIAPRSRAGAPAVAPSTGVPTEAAPTIPRGKSRFWYEERLRTAQSAEACHEAARHTLIALGASPRREGAATFVGKLGSRWKTGLATPAATLPVQVWVTVIDGAESREIRISVGEAFGFGSLWGVEGRFRARCQEVALHVLEACRDRLAAQAAAGFGAGAQLVAASAMSLPPAGAAEPARPGALASLFRSRNFVILGGLLVGFGLAMGAAADFKGGTGAAPFFAGLGIALLGVLKWLVERSRSLRFALLIVVVAGAASAAGVALFGSVEQRASGPPSGPGTQTATPERRRVTYRPDQLIIPPEEFPFPGYRVGTDKQLEGSPAMWRREFVAPPSSGYAWIVVDLGIAPAGGYSRAVSCEWRGTGTPSSSSAVTAQLTGESSHACRYAFASGFRVITYRVVSRNVLVFTQVGVAADSAEDVALLDLASVARRQLSIVDRIAPP